MSFNDLQAARKSKQQKSFLRAISDTSTETGTSNNAPEQRQAGSNSTQDLTTQGPNLKDVQPDGLYQCLSPSVQIKSSSKSGRGVYVKEKLKRSSTLISVKPHITSLSTKYLDSHCSSCCGPAAPSGLKRCTKCRSVWYCNATCQNNDWSMHKPECSAMRKWAASAPSPEMAIPSDAVRCLGRMLCKRKAEGTISIWTREINQLQSHKNSLPPSTYESHTHFAHSLVRYLGVSSPAELEMYGVRSAADLVHLISQFITNTITLSSPDLTPLGVAISPPIALINHSCDPNATTVFPRSSVNPSTQEPLMQVILLRDIEQDEEVTVSYIDTTAPRSERQKLLQDSYIFTCECSLCARPLDCDPRESMRCPKQCGGTCPLPTEENRTTHCLKCKMVVPNAEGALDAVRLGQEALEKVTVLQFQDPGKATELASNIIIFMTSAGLMSSSHPLLAMTRLYQSLLISALPHQFTQNILDEAIRAAVEIKSGLSDVLPEGHPVRGVALAELGKLLAVDEPSPNNQASFPPSGAPRLKLAYETLVRARKELLIGFGRDNDGGQIGRDVRDSIVSVERELGLWRDGIRNALEDASAAQKAARKSAS